MPFSSGVRNKWSRQSSSSTDKDDDPSAAVQRQITNARTRLQDVGVNVKTDTDRRNWFEKATNLPEGQNFIFDALELLGRPSQAILGMLNEKQTGGDKFGEAAWKGFSGQERTHGSDLMERAGVHNKLMKAVLGTGLEIALDPLMYVPGAAFTKVGRGVADAAKGLGKVSYGTLEKLPAFGRFSENTLRPAAQKAKDGLGYAFNRDYRIDETLGGQRGNNFLRDLGEETEATRRYMADESMRKVVDAAKLAGGLDAGADVGRIMEAPLKQFEDIQAFELPGGGTTTSKRELQNRIDDSRNRITELEGDLKDNFYTPKSLEQMAVGDKAYRIGENGKRLKGEKALEIEEVRNGSAGKEIRFKDEDTFIPANSVKPLGVSRTTELGGVNKQIADTADQLSRLDKQIRRQYFSRENAALRQLAGRKNKPVNIDELAQSRAFSQVGASPAFNVMLKQRDELKTQLNDLRTQATGLKDNTAAQIKQHQDDIEQFTASKQNPIIEQREIPRAERELSDDVNVREAARQLTRSNDEIRQYALDNGIHISEMEGYMKHVLSKAERESRQRRTPAGVDRGAVGTGNPNKKVVNARELSGSAEDINEQVGREFFNPNAFFSTAIGQKQLIDYVQAVQFRRKVLSNPDFATKYKKGMDIKPNQVVIDTNNYKFIKAGEEVPEGATALADEVGGEYLVTKATKNALDRYQKLTSDEGIQSMLKSYDAVLNNWKKLALLSPAYHARNLAGAMFNNYVGGMSMPNLVKYTSGAAKDVADALRGKGGELFEEYRKQGLGAEALSKVDFVRSVDPEKAIEKSVQRGEQSFLRRAVNLPETSREAGAVVDQVSRFAMYKWARDKGLTPQQAAAKVRETQFDYNKLSNFEREYVTRAVPFYRWMRNNIPFQLKQITSDPRKYAKVNTVRENAQDAVGLDEETMPDYMKEQFALPVYGNDKTGTGKILGLNLPLGDLTRLDDPLKLLVGSVNPLLKLPAELSLNRSFFTNKEIKKYEGDKTNYNLPGTALDFGIDPKLNYVLEQLGGQPTRMATTTFKDQGDVDQADQALRQTLGISSLLKDYDVNKYDYYKLLDELSKLQDYIQYIEQQRGQDVRTISEINRAAR
ncbi:hypothetical protein DFQ01_14447 [Paenibacillus cellulosilyticus]|uniref:Large polyvalent protein associated domain-containing protein n=1 Tax=Paenibacillus cellulosilyticus TaxID=375489 RepID=A0A2V2YE17_9BACL|nr:hypothetical protein [Paenibacillus cellulosilyticus]PWV90271.1 hypothetical protein DFQ01_14447 [Paenibacillus cellulosilyticus]QKS43429.1 hypothetical protein HUB94_02590 [Paenibacillus cellulosilyticus]